MVVTDKRLPEDRQMQEANVSIDSHVSLVTCDPRKLLKQRQNHVFKLPQEK